MGALGHSGVMLTDRGVRCLGLWFSIGICGIYLVFALQAALEEIFTTTFTGNKYLPHLVCPVIFSLNLYGRVFFFFASRWELNVGNGKVETTRRVRFGGLYPGCSDHPPFFFPEVESQKIVG